MRAYVMTTGVLFGLITVAHLWRVYDEGPRLATDPWYVLITLATAGLCLWAWRLLRLSPAVCSCGIRRWAGPGGWGVGGPYV
jgi:uncharacterized membrane protein